jgi:hypothetical protein
MPFALIGIGIILVIAAYNNKQDVLAGQVKQDLTGSTGFVYWIAALLIVGSIGYIKPLQTVSRIFLGLILVVLFVTNQGLFAKFNSALDSVTGRASAAETSDRLVDGVRQPREPNEPRQPRNPGTLDDGPLELTITPRQRGETLQ